MKTRYLLAILILGAFAGCSSGGDDSAADTASTDRNAEPVGEEAMSEASDASADSIPMTVTITLPSVKDASGTFHGGTFRSEGKGAQCENAGDGWSVIYPGQADSIGVAGVRLTVAKLAGGKTSSFSVTAIAGSIQGQGGPKTPLMHIISTGERGPGAPGTAPPNGSGAVTVTREGERVRFEVDGISGTTGRSFKMTLVCEREGKWV